MNRRSSKNPKITAAVPFMGLLAIVVLVAVWSGIFRHKSQKSPSQSNSEAPVLGCIYQGSLQQNEPLYLSLHRNGVAHRLISQLTPALKGNLDLRKCLPGDCYTLITTPDSILHFEYRKGMLEKCDVIRENGTLQAKVEPLEFNCVVKSLSGEIESSLWESMIDKCESPELIMKFTEVLEWEIDFLTEPRRGDTFRVLYEEYHKNGEFIRYGDILAAEYSLGEKSHQSVLYRSPDGKKSYYEPSGKSSRKAFLKSPLNYRRISSRFSYRRFHPVFKRYQPHLGVDYAAPVGTPVVASGDGTVAYAGWKRGFGKIVEIRHTNGFVTSYGHLSRFAKGIRKGARVSQKQLIGYVGNTGASTGPHLDYRVKANGRYVNPLRMVAPPVDPVKEEYMADFLRQRDNLLYALDFMTSTCLLAAAQDQ
jgi:murein DD-endopeptidase MepM/ murein hydrolase activator NlpD